MRGGEGKSREEEVEKNGKKERKRPGEGRKGKKWKRTRKETFNMNFLLHLLPNS